MVRFNIISDLNTEALEGPSNLTEEFLANEILKTTKPYVPARTGSFSNRAHVEGGTVVYPGPYARYLYYGKTVEGPKAGPKRATDKNLVFTTDMHPMAQAHWFEASKAQNLERWMRGARKLMGNELEK